MKHVGKHPNIVNLIACCTVKPPLLIVMEYIGCGDLVSSSDYHDFNQKFIKLINSIASISSTSSCKT